ncbi:AraC family transcriptional regulator [Albimonas pacifica]|uniref:Transcriptional regulator, AraC family n=1 Tax=Albimonas pacifica TaxID=1114924 RepID=A0A1I3BJV5_9RHOB|nr:AraC family transcriptional regulator [Albimonas pacifica]SFH62543.1 transcriptional regulator, AraC family [Albimonas pacifica]
MAAISALFVRKHIAAAERIADKRALWVLAGLTPQAAEDPEAWVAPDAYFALLEAIAESEAPDVRFLTTVCAAMRCEEFGAIGLALKSAPTLRHAFQRQARYALRFNSASTFAFEDLGEVYGFVHRSPQAARPGAWLSSEGALATFVTLFREATGPDLRPVRVQFRHPPLGTRGALEALFGVAPEYGAEADGMQFSTAHVDRPCAVGDLAIWRWIHGQVDRELAAREARAEAEGRDLEVRVIEAAAARLSDGAPSLAEVAAGLGMGARTLQRRLSERGLTFQALVDEARRRLAQELVAGSRYSLAEIAFLTGFSEQSAFTRAFKRWSGRSPRAWREGAQAS